MGQSAEVDNSPANEVAKPKLSEALLIAESLEPDDRLRLIVRLWASLPPDHWAAPTASELAEVARRLNDDASTASIDPPWGIVRQMLFKQTKAPPRRPPSRIYSAPRRFDLATIFIATTAYCLLLTGMTLLDAWPIIKLYIGAFITLVGASQALLFDVLDPRRASILVGASVHTIFSLILFAMNPNIFFGSLFLAVLFNGVLGGLLFGYLAGALAAGVFLVADVLRGKFVLNRPAEEPQPLPADAISGLRQGNSALSSIE